jgi:titin
VGLTYRFRLAAVNQLGTGVFSDEIQLVATDAPGTPTITLGLGETARALDGFRLNFGRPTSSGGSPHIGFLLYRDEGISGSPFTLAFNGSSMPQVADYTVTGLQTALTYQFRVYALNKIFQSSTPATISLLVGTLPEIPTNIRRADTAYTAGEIPILWDAPVNQGGVALTGFEVWVDDGAGSFSAASPAATPGPSDSSATLASLTVGTVYGFRMKATNAVGTGAYSDIVYLVCADKPATPTAPSADSSTRNSISLAWNAPSDGSSPINGYRVYMNALAVGDWVLAYAGEGYPTRQTFTATGLTEGEQYRFMLSAFNLVGESGNSTEAIFTASDLPGGPSQP